MFVTYVELGFGIAFRGSAFGIRRSVEISTCTHKYLYTSTLHRTQSTLVHIKEYHLIIGQNPHF